MSKNLSLLLIGASLLMAAPASAFPLWPHSSRHAPSDLGELVYRGADRLVQNIQPRPGKSGIITPSDQVIVTTLVSVDDLSQSSTLGRAASQLILSRLSQLGYQVRDVTYLRSLDISETGERVLSRDARRLAKDYAASAIVAGTYSVGGMTIILNLRLLSAQDGSLISSADIEVPLDADTWPLINTKAPRFTRSPETVIFGEPYPQDRGGERGEP